MGEHHSPSDEKTKLNLLLPVGKSCAVGAQGPHQSGQCSHRSWEVCSSADGGSSGAQVIWHLHRGVSWGGLLWLDT